MWKFPLDSAVPMYVYGCCNECSVVALSGESDAELDSDLREKVVENQVPYLARKTKERRLGLVSYGSAKTISIHTV